ncbi:MAG: hypothetical protein CM15mP98_07410 [Paracoccaceae bacterium]|nr:MAG: hypothetical protein CM15mP98_07410 [Paracoccaceae bacterium]
MNGPGEALMTDIGFTGGGAGSGMIYRLGKTDHKLDNDKMIDHIVDLVEERAKSFPKNINFSCLKKNLRKLLIVLNF